MQPEPTTPAMLTLRVRTLERLTESVLRLVLESTDGQKLPDTPAGCHVDLHLAPGLARSYSVVGSSHGQQRWEFAIARDANSRGGSRAVHENLRLGQLIQTSTPRNAFALDEGEHPTLLIAGGIGITPLWAMARRLETLGRPYILFYATRSRSLAAYLDDISNLLASSQTGRLILHFDDEADGAAPDLPSLLTQLPSQAHLYCCGPGRMLEAFESATANWPSSQVHLERFGPVVSVAHASTDEFEVILSQSGLRFTVPADRSILDMVLDHGVNASYGCMQGSCGMCQTRVIEGQPDHRDHILSEADRAQGNTMLICCSRSHSKRLTLEL